MFVRQQSSSSAHAFARAAANVGFSLEVGRGNAQLRLTRPVPFAFGIVRALELVYRGLPARLELHGGYKQFRHRPAACVRFVVSLDENFIQTQIANAIGARVRLLSITTDTLVLLVQDDVRSLELTLGLRIQGTSLYLWPCRTTTALAGVNTVLEDAFLWLEKLSQTLSTSPICEAHAGLHFDEGSGMYVLEDVLHLLAREALLGLGFRIPDTQALAFHSANLENGIELTFAEAAVANETQLHGEYHAHRHAASAYSALRAALVGESGRDDLDFFRALRNLRETSVPVPAVLLAEESERKDECPPIFASATLHDAAEVALTLRFLLKRREVERACSYALRLDALASTEVAAEGLLAAAKLARERGERELESLLLERAFSRGPTMARGALPFLRAALARENASSISSLCREIALAMPAAEDRAEAFLAGAEELVARARFADAAALLRGVRALGLPHKSIEALLLLAGAHEAQKDWSAALLVLAEAAHLGREHATLRKSHLEALQRAVDIAEWKSETPSQALPYLQELFEYEHRFVERLRCGVRWIARHRQDGDRERAAAVSLQVLAIDVPAHADLTPWLEFLFTQAEAALAAGTFATAAAFLAALERREEALSHADKARLPRLRAELLLLERQRGGRLEQALVAYEAADRLRGAEPLVAADALIRVVELDGDTTKAYIAFEILRETETKGRSPQLVQLVRRLLAALPQDVPLHAELMRFFENLESSA